ncbi:hypothetical protein KSP40_PGU016844 [Platanthera guangdongensis]|uniref:Uncharacterized protein n=1 Tax=Platanthera guangdongensis TaxID=2320717 RepID=A0ABR2MQA0_9ASPA
MACSSQSVISASSCSFSSQSQRILSKPRWAMRKKAGIFPVNASSSSEESVDCNVEECAPDKEISSDEDAMEILHIVYALLNCIALHVEFFMHLSFCW